MDALAATSEDWARAATVLRKDLGKSADGARLLGRMVDATCEGDVAAAKGLVNVLSRESGMAITSKQCARLAQLPDSTPYSAQLVAVLPCFQSAVKARQAYFDLFETTLRTATTALETKDLGRFEYSCDVLRALVCGQGRRADDKIQVPVARVLAVIKRGVSRSHDTARQTTLASLSLLEALMVSGQRKLLPWAWPVCEFVESALRISEAWSEVFRKACSVVEQCARLGVGVSCRLFENLMRSAKPRSSLEESLPVLVALRACVQGANGYADVSLRSKLAKMLLEEYAPLLSSYEAPVDLLGLVAASCTDHETLRRARAMLSSLCSTWRVSASALRALASMDHTGEHSRATVAPIHHSGKRTDSSSDVVTAKRARALSTEKAKKSAVVAYSKMDEEPPSLSSQVGGSKAPASDTLEVAPSLLAQGKDVDRAVSSLPRESILAPSAAAAAAAKATDASRDGENDEDDIPDIV